MELPATQSHRRPFLVLSSACININYPIGLAFGIMGVLENGSLRAQFASVSIYGLGYLGIQGRPFRR